MTNTAIETTGTKETRGTWIVTRNGETVATCDDYRNAEEAQFLISLPCTGDRAARLNNLLKG